MAELITQARSNLNDALRSALNISNENRDSFTSIISELIGGELEVVEREVLSAFRNEQLENLSGENLESYVFNQYGLIRFPARRAYSNEIQLNVTSASVFGDLNDGANITLPAGTELGVDSNFVSVVFLLKEEVVLDSLASSVQVSVEAKEPGSSYNIRGENLIYIDSPVSSSNGSISIYQPYDISNGSDLESDESLRIRAIRFLERRTNLNKNSLFASMLNEPSIFDFEIIESYFGIGSIGVVIKGFGYGRVSNDEIEKVREIIAEFQFLGQRIEVVLPIEARLDLTVDIKSTQEISADEKETLQNSINKFILDELKLMEFQGMLSLRNVSNRVLESFAVEAIGEQNIFSEAYISKMERFSSETNPIRLDHSSSEGFFLSSDETITNVRIDITLE